MKKQTPRIEDMPEILTLRQASEILNVHMNTLRNWDNGGILKALRYGRREDRRYRKKDVIAYMK